MKPIFALVFIKVAIQSFCMAQAVFTADVGNASPSKPSIRVNNIVKSHKLVFLYEGGSLNHIRYDPRNAQLDTIYIDHQKIEEIAYQTAFGSSWQKYQNLIKQVTDATHPSLRIMKLSANTDTLNAIIGIYALDTTANSSGGIMLENVVFIVRMMGDTLVAIENITPFIKQFDHVVDNGYVMDADYAIMHKEYYVMPALTMQPISDSSKSLLRVSAHSPHRFLGWEKVSLPRKNIAEQLGYNYLAPIWHGDYFMYSTNDKIYQFSTMTEYDLAPVLSMKDTSSLTGNYRAPRQVHDICDLGGDSLAILVRHGSNLRLIKLKIEKKNVTVVYSTLVASRYPNSEAGFPTFFLDGVCVSYDRVSMKFRQLKYE